VTPLRPGVGPAPIALEPLSVPSFLPAVTQVTVRRGPNRLGRRDAHVVSRRVLAHQVKPGDWVRWYGTALRVERIHHQSLSSMVSLFAGTEHLLLGWNDPVELVDAP
jgi:hypothetical protein